MTKTFLFLNHVCSEKEGDISVRSLKYCLIERNSPAFVFLILR